MTSVWLAERLSKIEETDQDGLFGPIEDDLSYTVGLFSPDGTPLRPSALDRLMRTKIRHLINNSASELTLDGEHMAAASSPVYTARGRHAIVVASGYDARYSPNPWYLLKLIGLAAVFIGLGVGFGYLHGVNVSHLLKSVRQRISLLILNPILSSTDQLATDRGADANISGGPKPISVAAPREVAQFHHAISVLEKRFYGELAFYMDALDEVQIVDDRRTASLTSVATELRAPLISIEHQADELLRGLHGEMNDSQLDDMRIVQQATGRLLNLTDEIMEFSSLIRGEIEFDDTPVDLCEVANEVVQTARGQLGDKPINMYLDNPLTPVHVEGNRQRIWQVMTNLVSNAVKFTEQGEIEISVATADGRSALFEVRDTGIGIPQKDQSLIFAPFQQSGDLAHRSRGTGLGLAIVKRLVELHEGSIRVVSKHGQGSTFAVSLPFKRD